MNTKPNRANPDKHKAQMRAASAARYAATKRLIQAHEKEWQRLYTEEATRRGVTPSGTPETPQQGVPVLRALHDAIPRPRKRTSATA